MTIWTTLDPGDYSGCTLALGNLEYLWDNVSTIGGARALAPKTTGQYTFNVNYHGGAAPQQAFGVAAKGLPIGGVLSTGVGCSIVATGASDGGFVYIEGVMTASIGSPINPAVCAVNLNTALIWFSDSVANEWNNSPTANPATGVGGFDISATLAHGPVVPFGQCGMRSADGGTFNFGSTPGLPVISGFTPGWPLSIPMGFFQQVQVIG